MCETLFASLCFSATFNFHAICNETHISGFDVTVSARRNYTHILQYCKLIKH